MKIDGKIYPNGIGKDALIPILVYENQPEMEYKENLSFWEKHALIEEGL